MNGQGKEPCPALSNLALITKSSTPLYNYDQSKALIIPPKNKDETYIYILSMFIKYYLFLTNENAC